MGIRTWLTGAAVLLADAATKLAAADCLGEQRLKLGGLLELRLTHNKGIALGLLSGNTLAILLLPLAVMAGGWFLLRRYRLTPYLQFSLGLIVGGFLGNFAQRLLRGYVVDMIYFPWMPWFVCNVADIAICFGVGLLVISLLFRPGDWREKNAEEKPDSAR